MYTKKKILFVGSFSKELPDGRIGGQMVACYALINSKLNEQVDWVLLDTNTTKNSSGTYDD